jgi:hypothetical protein
MIRTISIVISFLIISLSSSSAQESSVPSVTDVEKADQLGDEFQRQMPWYARTPQSGAFFGIPQPKEYLSAPESEIPPESSEYLSRQYPLCYDPYTGSYEYCKPRNSYYFRVKLRSPQFRFWWSKGRFCPYGYFFIPDRGCYRY